MGRVELRPGSAVRQRDRSRGRAPPRIGLEAIPAQRGPHPTAPLVSSLDSDKEGFDQASKSGWRQDTREERRLWCDPRPHARTGEHGVSHALESEGGADRCMPRFSNHLTYGTPQEEVRDALSSVQPWEDDNWTREQAVQRLCGYFEKAAKRIRNLKRFKDAGEDEHQIKAMVEEFVKEGYGTAVGACYGKAWFDKVDLEKWIRPVYASAHMHMPVIRKWSPVAMAVEIQQRTLKKLQNEMEM